MLNIGFKDLFKSYRSDTDPGRYVAYLPSRRTFIACLPNPRRNFTTGKKSSDTDAFETAESFPSIA